jgi:hypothetical protein
MTICKPRFFAGCLSLSLAFTTRAAVLETWRAEFKTNRPHSRLEWMSQAIYAADRRSAALRSTGGRRLHPTGQCRPPDSNRHHASLAAGAVKLLAAAAAGRASTSATAA